MDDEVRRLVDDMFETMDAAQGVGLAANQVGVARRVAVVDADDDRFAMIDPVIVETEGRDDRRGGLPLDPRDLRRREPARAGRASRPPTATAAATARKPTGLKARAIQHEIDHLDGILFLDHLSLIKRQMLLARYRREHKDDTGYHQRGAAGIGRLGVMRIVFFGTPEFAVPSLQALLRRAVRRWSASSPSPTGRTAARAPRWCRRR